MDSFVRGVLKTIERYCMLAPGDALVVGVSGGADSMALLNCLCELQQQLQISLTVAHLDHQIRGEQARREAEFVEDAARLLGLACVVGARDVPAYRRQQGVTLQEAAREMRYGFFQEVMQEVGANKLALGHHGDDQAETVVMRLLRGTGLQGLGGIPPVRDGRVVRPLIDAARTEIESFLQERGITFVGDTSGAEQQYLRNHIRHQLLPQMKREYNPQLAPALRRTAEQARLDNDFLELCAADHVAQVLKKEGAYLRCLKHDLRNRHPALQGRMLRRIIAELKGDMRGISSRHIDSLLRLLRNDGPGRSVQIPGGVEVRREYDYLLFNIKQSGALPFCYTVQALPARLSILETGQKLSFALLSRDEVADEVQCSRDSGCAHVDADEISFPLIVRSWQAGDRFHPLGMQGSKKIKDLFSDCKVPARTRQAVPLVMCGGRILWVGGMRLDERFKVTGKTENVLRIRLV